MPVEQFANDAQTTINMPSTGLGGSTSDTSLTVLSAAGFPTSAQFRIKIDNELMLVTAGAGTTTWTVSRQIESTTVAAHAHGAQVTHVLTAGALKNLDASYIAAGELALDRGGTGIDASGVSDGQLLIGKTSDHSLNLATLTAGDGISITNGPGSVEIANTGGGAPADDANNILANRVFGV